MRTVTLMLAIATLFGPLLEAEARQDPRRFGPFRLGMTAAQFRAAAANAGLRVRPEVEQERDMMGLALMTVMPVVAASPEAAPQPGRIWRVTGYLLSGHLAHIDLSYGDEDVRRRDRWFADYGAPSNARNKIQDLTWMNDGVVTHIDRFGTHIAAVDWGGLKASDRVLVSAEGAVRVANRYFRRRQSKVAEASIEHLREQVTAYYEKLSPGEDGDGCVPPPSTGYTPAESACDLPERRFEANSPKWTEKPWGALGVRPHMMSRQYSFVMETSGSGRNTRISIVAVGDLDCDQQVSTIRVVLRSDRSASQRTCRLDAGTWEIINPTE